MLKIEILKNEIIKKQRNKTTKKLKKEIIKKKIKKKIKEKKKEKKKVTVEIHLNPWFSLPIRFSTGTFTSSKVMSDFIKEERVPLLPLPLPSYSSSPAPPPMVIL